MNEINDNIIIQFQNEQGENTGPPLELSIHSNVNQLETLINHLLNNEEKLPYSFYIKDQEIIGDVKTIFLEQKCSKEETLIITYQPQAIFRVKSVTRCTSSLAGHSDAVLNVSFSPDSLLLASGSGDKTVRIWDVLTETLKFTLQGHKNWVLYVCWSPDNKKLATGGMDHEIRIWCPKTGKQIGSSLKGHKRFITAISWEPLHKNPDCNRLVTSSKDCTVKIWDIRLSKCIFSLSSHTMSVTCVKWGGEGLIYSGSQDRTIKVWQADEGKLCRTLEGHGHWVNTLALNTDYILKMGSFDHNGKGYEDKNQAQKIALEKYQEMIKLSGGTEKLVSGSDDFTMFLWEGSKSKKPITRMTGHSKLINFVCFSPDGRYIASASFDKSIKIWNGIHGKFIVSLIGHVEAVYQICWSADSRLLVSCSRDSTLKVWDIHNKKLKFDLPGHADEVYSVDMAFNGERVASGSKDHLVKIWKN